MTQTAPTQVEYEILRKGRWFESVPEPLQNALLERACVRHLPAGTVISCPGDGPKGLWAVLDGCVRMASEVSPGRSIVHMLIEPPTWFGEVTSIDRRPQFIEASAAVDTHVLHVPQVELEAVLELHPALWEYLAQLLAHRLRIAVLALVDAESPSLQARLARRLAIIIEGYGDRARRHTRIRISQENLGLMLGMSRQTVNRLLKDLQQQQLLAIGYGEIEILDEGRLLAFADKQAA
ncbi:MAG TPA: Crp/Fnr family transcriptional regulator [Kofleriaceae bacterium]